MDIGPVERIRTVGQVGVVVGPADVAPALGVKGAARMDDDSYRESRKNQDRGMEEEVIEESADESEPDAGTVKKRGVNCFA